MGRQEPGCAPGAPAPPSHQGSEPQELTGGPLRCRHLQSPVCKAFRHVKVDTLSQPEALSRISVPGSGDATGPVEMAELRPKPP